MYVLKVLLIFMYSYAIQILQCTETLNKTKQHIIVMILANYTNSHLGPVIAKLMTIIHDHLEIQVNVAQLCSFVC